jgi:hypothetical protein
MTNAHECHEANRCTCRCHETPEPCSCKKECGCSCACRKHPEHCECCGRPPCCGEPEKPNRPSWPPAPGWAPGDKPAKNPLGGETNEEERHRRFTQAVVDIIRGGSGPKGPRFGPRKNEYLPYLLVRANPGDRGKRPLSVPFWESPDVFVAPRMDAATAPAQPPTPGGVAEAGVPNTLWARVWNLGRAPAFNARVEFYWFNPSLGFSGAAANLIGVTHVDLGHRSSGKAMAMVKCPASWVPTYVNGGHECLMVRAFEPLTDPLSNPWNAGDDRHLGQRNISVVNAASPATIDLNLRLGCAEPPGDAQVEVKEVPPDDVTWLALLAGQKEHGYRRAAHVDQVAGVLHPTLVRSDGQKATLAGTSAEAAERLLRRQVTFRRGCDEQELLFHMVVDGLKHRECRVYRILQHVGGRLVGGYTVIARRP